MSSCSACGKNFSCGMVDADASNPCWCTALPALPPEMQAQLNDGRGVDEIRCFCPECLATHIETATARAASGPPVADN